MMKRQAVLLPLIAVLLLPVQLHAADFYVATNGDDSNSGTSVFSPLRTIAAAIDSASMTGGKPHTIHLGAGTWAANDFGENFPVQIPDSTSLVGAGMEQTVLNAQQNGYALYIVGDTSVTISDLKVINGANVLGGGVLVGSGAHQVTLSRLWVTKSSSSITAGKTSIPASGIGGGLLVSGATDITVENCLFNDNSADSEGGAIGVIDSHVELYSLTIVNNTAGNSGTAAIYDDGTGTVLLNSSIVWMNGNDDGYSRTISSSVSVDYTLAEIEPSGDIDPSGTGNFWAFPLFEDPEGDYHLLQGSMGVDTGDPLLSVGDEPEPNGTRINIGAYGGTDEATISGANLTLDKNRLYFFGVPVDPPSYGPVDVFQDDFGVMFSDTTWDLYKQDLNTSLSGPTAPDFTIAPGNGFFIQQKMAPKFTINAEGHAVTQQEDFVRSLPDVINGSDGYDWSWVANPFPYSIHLSNTMFGVESAGNIPFESAAESELGSRYAYILGAGHRFIPTAGKLDPWEGAILLTRNIDEWQVSPNRDASIFVDPTADLDWMLRLDARAVDGDGNVIAQDNGHQWGFGPTRADTFDDGDALSIVLSDGAFRVESLPWSSTDEVALFHDFRRSQRSTKAIWKYQVTGSDTLPGNIEIEFTGIDTTTGAQFPDSALTLFFVYDLGDQDLPSLVEDLRYKQNYELEFPQVGDGLRRRIFWVMVDSTGWNWSSVEEPGASALPQSFAIESVYPNPFNPATTVSVTMPERGALEVKVYDLLGREVVKLASGVQEAGQHRLTFDGKNLASGVYFVRAVSGAHVDVKKMVLLR